MTVAMQELF